MRAAEAFLRLLYLGPLLAGAVLAPLLLDAPPGPGLAFAIAAAYARLATLAAGASWLEEALLLAESLPFLAFQAARAGGTGYALAVTAESAAAGAALLLAESLVRNEGRGGYAALAFVAAAAAAGLAIDRLGPATVLGGAVAIVLLCAFALRRRA